MRIIETNQGDALVILNNIDSVKTSKIKEVLSGETPVVVTPDPVFENTNSGVTVKAESINNKEERFFRISGPIKGLAYGNKPDDFGVFYGGVFVQKLCVWEVILLLNNNTKIKVKLNWNGDFQLTGDNNVIIEGTTEVVEPVTSPVVDQTQPRPQGENLSGFAEIGKWYSVFQKTMLHLSSYVAGDVAQYYSVKKDGVKLFEMNTNDGEVQPVEEIHSGNHPPESVLPINEGEIELYFENTSNQGGQVCGLITGHNMAYEQYKADGLKYADGWKRIEKGQTYTQKFDIKHNRGGLRRDGQFEIFFPAFKDGKQVTLKRPTFNGSVHGLGNTFVNQFSTHTIRYSLLHDTSLWVDVEVQTYGLNDYPRFRVVAKNGLDVHPNHFIVDAYFREYKKIFNNHCSGYKSQPEHPDNQI